MISSILVSKLLHFSGVEDEIFKTSIRQYASIDGDKNPIFTTNTHLRLGINYYRENLGYIQPISSI